MVMQRERTATDFEVRKLHCHLRGSWESLRDPEGNRKGEATPGLRAARVPRSPARLQGALAPRARRSRPWGSHLAE